MRRLLVPILYLALVSCGSSAGKTGTAPPPHPGGDEPAPPGVDEPAPTERPELTVEACEARGTVVGDIGDGAVHRPDYRCPDGQAPIGTVPSGIEGAVCCPT